LHVLGLPLAFILSQDQTLHCKRKFNLLKILHSRKSSPPESPEAMKADHWNFR
jgi:hypothetical protein